MGPTKPQSPVPLQEKVGPQISVFSDASMSERVDLVKLESGGKLARMRAPRFVSWSLFVMLGLPACGRTGAVPPAPAPAATPPTKDATRAASADAATMSEPNGSV